MPAIILSTLNARYSHCALGLRYLLANLGELRAEAGLLEFTLQERPADIAERLLAGSPRIIGFGVYIWNVREITETVAILKQVSPETVIVLGGPEVSHETEDQAVVQAADYVLTGAADLAFAALCREILAGRAPTRKIIPVPPPPLSALALPYREYSAEDIAQRTLYVEASRGCPFKCEFCLSSLDKTVYPFDLDLFLAEIEQLWQRGARRFKFVDRTFNLKPAHSERILEFFLARISEGVFLHFELIPDHLPARLKSLLCQFPPGSLQLEIGIQTFNPEVQARISRKQDTARSLENLHFLRTQTHAHLHTDLIIGLPGEDLASFADSFDRLIALAPHEIQVGILKRLRGAPIARHTASYEMCYQSNPPYSVLRSRDLDFFMLQRLSRFARYWDLIGNSGHFSHTRPILLGEQPFARFLRLSDWLYATTGQTHGIALYRLFELVYRGLTGPLNLPADRAAAVLEQDYQLSGQRRELSFAPPRQARHRA